MALTAAYPDWRGDLLALLGGPLVTLSLAPFDIWPLGILACMLLLLATAKVSAGRACWRGWLFGLGLFGSGISWVYVSIQVHGNAPVPLAIVLVSLFSAGLALLPALMCRINHQASRANTRATLLIFPALWVLFEWLRNWLLTGFPWLYLGYGHLSSPLAGWAPIVGVFGISMICALTASVLYQLISRPRPALRGAIAFTVALWLGGPLLLLINWTQPTGKHLRLALIQPDIAQQIKWSAAHFDAIVTTLRDMTASLRNVDLVVWPEAALPAVYQTSQPLIDSIAAAAKTGGYALLTGMPYRAVTDDGFRYHNSVVLIDAERQAYHKQKLVPFGEYVPLESWLRGLIDFFDLPMSNFSKGPADQPPLMLGEWRISPLICYEIAYGDFVRRSAARSDLLLTVSNDSWFGKSIGPLQHFEMARMRALENSRYIVRATNNGISAIIDQRGQIVVQGPPYSREVILGEAVTMSGSTPYTRWGDWPILLGATLLLAGAYRRRPA